MVKRHIKRVRSVLSHPTLSGIWELVLTNKFKTFMIALVIFLFILFTEQFKAFVLIALFTVVASTVTIYKRVIRMPPVFELISLTTVMITLFFGPIVGTVYTVIVNLGSEISSGYPDVMTLTYLPSRTIQVWSVFAMASLTDMSVAAIGIWSVVLFNIIQQPIFMLLTDTEQRLKAIYFVALNIPINIILFRTLAQPLYIVISAIL